MCTSHEDEVWFFPDDHKASQGVDSESHREPVARIAKCMLDEVVRNGISEVTDEPIKLWFDTMASHSITSDKSLFGVDGPLQKCDVVVQDWGDARFGVSECGMTCFGLMLYHERAAGTILAGFEMEQLFDLDWVRNKVEVVATFKQDRQLVIRFKTTPESRVMEGEVTGEVYEMVCRLGTYIRSEHELEEVKILKMTLDQGAFKRSLEAMHFHDNTCHTCTSYIAISADTKILSNMPFCGRDVHNIEHLSDGKCPCCAVGKCTWSSRDPHRVAAEGSGQTTDMADVEFVYSGDPLSMTETVGFDLMFIDGLVTVVGVGRNRGYKHVVTTPSRKAGVIKRAMDLIINDYARFGVLVDELINARQRAYVKPKHHMFGGQYRPPEPGAPRPISMVDAIEVDNEAAFIDAALHLVSNKKQKLVFAFVVSGEHVSYVERAIRTIKERVSSMRSSIHFRIEKKMLSWLISHAVMWINVLFSKRSPRSAWWNLTNTQLSYRDLTRTKFGDPVIASRPGVLKHGQPRGELGWSMGANPRQPGAIFFYSGETGNVKSRLRFKTHIDVDSQKTFGKNRTFIEPASVAKSYLKYVRERRTALDLESETVMPADISEGDSSDKLDDASSCFINGGQGVELSADLTGDADDHSGEEKSRVVNDPEAVAMALTIDQICVMACRHNGNNKTLTWAKALMRDGAKGSIALEAIQKELKQIVIDYDVCKPVIGRVENFHFSHDLYDALKDKARLVVGKKIRDIIIEYGVELNSPTINGKLVNVMLSTCIEQGLELEVWDVKGAFLKAPLPTPGVYVKLMPHIVVLILDLLKVQDSGKFAEWTRAVRPDGSLIVEVNKGWYGLACSSMIWYQEIAGTLMTEGGYSRHPLERCLFHRIDQAGKWSYVLLHVDDMAVMAGEDGVEHARLRRILEVKYEALKVQTGDKVKYIGFEITRNRIENRFQLTMSEYINRLCEVYDIVAGNRKISNPASCEEYGKSVYTTVEDETPVGDIAKYRSLVMSMQYGTLVMPSVKYHVILLATRQVAPKQGDMKKARRVLQYMQSKASKPVYIYGYGENPDIYVYADAAFDVYSDSISHGGISVFIGNAGGAMYSSSNKQKCVTDSSTAAEVVSAVNGMPIGQYFRQILVVFGVFCNVIHMEDNMSCIAMVKSGCVSWDKKDRHIVRKINLMHEYFEDVDNHAVMVWCDTAWMIADGQTKALHGPAFEISENVQMGHALGDIGDYGVRAAKAVK